MRALTITKKSDDRPAIAIPTLSQYPLLKRLCDSLTLTEGESSQNFCTIAILDNGGELAKSHIGEELSNRRHIRIYTPPHNLGVAGSWNFFAEKIDRCIIANDDVVFGKKAVEQFQAASAAKPAAIIIENDHPIGGFSTFLLNRPAEWLSLGGFDEMFNPAYFEDNDARRRLFLAGRPTVKITLSDWHHDNSSTLTNSDFIYKRMHWCLYSRNKDYYIKKWGGVPMNEIYITAFGHKINRIIGKEAIAPISLGELIDKITILQIKTKHLKETALENVQKELTALQGTLDALDLQVDPILIQRLKEVNQQLWQIEDDIRDQERQKSFGESFIQLARSLYQENDRRAAIKKEINTTYGSALVEEKAYEDY